MMVLTLCVQSRLSTLPMFYTQCFRHGSPWFAWYSAEKQCYCCLFSYISLNLQISLMKFRQQKKNKKTNSSSWDKVELCSLHAGEIVCRRQQLPQPRFLGKRSLCLKGRMVCHYSHHWCTEAIWGSRLGYQRKNIFPFHFPDVTASQNFGAPK